MQSEVRLLGADALDRVDWPATHEAQWARRYLVPLITAGPRAYIDNVDAEMLVLRVDDRVWPVVVPAGRPDNAEVCSMHAHYIEYTAHEMKRRKGDHPQRLLRRTLPLAGAVLRACRVDDAVYVNNWLFATNPAPDLTPERARRATAFLTGRFPDRAVVFRSVNPLICRPQYEALRLAGYRMIPSRTVYLVDPTSRAFARSRDAKRDLKLLASGACARVGADALDDADVARIAELYRALYLDKHTWLNPAYTARWVELVVRGGTFAFTGLKRDGALVAFSAHYSQGDVITGSLIGYDPSLPQEFGLYRQAIALKLLEASRTGHLLNLSAGAAEFKLLRGAAPCIEYDAVYDRHLPPWRRFAFTTLIAGGAFQRAMAARASVTAPTL